MSNVNYRALLWVFDEREGRPINPTTLERGGPENAAELKALRQRVTDCEIARQFVILPDDGE